MKKLLSLALALCLLLSVGATALADDVPTFTMACNRWTEVWGTDFTETAFLKEIGEKTGVNIEWQPYYNQNWAEQKSLMLASGLSALPDAFFGSISLNDSDIALNEDFFVDLTDLITYYSSQSREKAQDLLSAIDEMILYNRSSKGTGHGLSIYYPYQNKQLYLEKKNVV